MAILGDYGAAASHCGGEVRRRVREARFVGRLRLPAASESCLWRDEIAALQEIVAAYDAGQRTDAYQRSPGLIRTARAYLWLLAWHEKHRDAVAVVLAGEEH